ncbi:MAG: hypothetical protein D8M58_16110 [Calditrichaeota bacterium]|nr:MAG: hypothetical protein DWQ03_07840 [Calditrichota bacterium]MBL1206930.1 hypothetical protein [Calditrichota bacterium]NOG46757.1 hypothetical protein [Calditrichota bacterium]
MVMKNLVFIYFIFVLFNSFLFSQDSIKTTTNDSTKIDSLKKASLDSALFINNDSLSLQLVHPVNKKIPKNVITMPKLSNNPLKIDTRTSSYYTPRNVQDKMDQIMNRPRSDNFVPVLAMAAFAAKVAAQQLEIDKLFELKAKDYLITDEQFSVLEKLWIKSPLRIDKLYLSTDLKNETTARELQTTLSALADKGLIKTRDAGENNIMFFPAQKSDKVISMVKSALNDPTIETDVQLKLQSLLQKLQKITPEKTE